MTKTLSEHYNSAFEAEDCILTFMKLIEDLFVPEVETGFDQPINPSDYSSYICCCVEKFKVVREFLDKELCDSNGINKYKKKFLSLVVILCGQHSSSNKWTTNYTVDESVVILNKCLKLFGYYSFEIALSAEHCDLFKHICKKMRPWLLKDSWKKFPANVVCYSWLLSYVKSPNLSDHLDVVLPTALIITDDFVSEYRIIGLKSLEHIINNVAMTQLSWYGQDEVILKALEPIFYQKDEELIPVLVETFVALLKKKYPLCSQTFLVMNEFDDSINIFIKQMKMEQKLKLRSAYIISLGKIIGARGLGMLNHSPIVIEVIVEYVLEPTSSVESLCVLQSFIDVCWPRMDRHCKEFLILISKCFLGLKSRGYPPECEKHIQAIFFTLRKLCPEIVDSFMSDINKESSLIELQTIFH